jgi:hypothetical protein
MKAMIDCTANKYDTYYEYHFAKLALIHKLKLPISQGDQVNLVMGGLEDERIKIAIETSNINTPEVLAAHFRVLDEQRLGRSKPETSNVSPTVSPAISKPKTYTNTQRATGAEKYRCPRTGSPEKKGNLRANILTSILKKRSPISNDNREKTF